MGATEKTKGKMQNPSPASGGAYFLGIIGSAVYFVHQVDGFWPVILALLKALVWPAFMVYYLLNFLVR